ncbi:MAG: hypothetical protein ABR887_04090 [Methanoregulaceae archaeon]
MARTTTERGRLRFISGRSVQLPFQGGQKTHRHVHFAGGTLGQDLLSSPLCGGEFPHISQPLDLEDQAPVPLRQQQVIIERERILCNLPVHLGDVSQVGEVQAVVRVERGGLDEDILVIGVCEEFPVCGGEVVLDRRDVEIETFGDFALVLVHRCVPEDKRVGKVQAPTDEDSDDENEDLVLSFFVHRLHTPCC